MRFARAAAIGGVLAIGACREPRPRADAAITAEPADASSDWVVGLEDDGTCRVDGTEVPLAGLAAAAKAQAARASTVRIEAAATAGWGSVVAVLDALKSAGINLPSVLSVRGDAARRTEPFTLPKAATSGSGDMILVFPVPGAPAPRIVAPGRFHTVTVTREAALTLDGAGPEGGLASALAKLGDLRDAGVTVNADTAAPLGSIVDVVLIAQRTGAAVAFGIAPIAIPRAPTTPPALPAGALTQCPFPAHADRDRIDDGSATLRVRVGADGKVTDVKVLKDDGHGFGAAAQACARRVDFAPARDAEGHAVDGERTLRVHFAR